MGIELFEFNGKVISAAEFVRKYIDKTNLNDKEKKILKYALLPEEKDVPNFLKIPRTRADWLKKRKSKTIMVERHGERSAYWPEKNIKFKGCNPANNSKTFPSESFFFGKEHVDIKTIPYGILTKEQVMREILGYAFFIKHGLKTNIRPICVYSNHNGCTLVEHTVCESRIESFFDFKEIDTHKLIIQEASRKTIGLRCHLGAEVNLDRINVARYIYKKALLLVTMNFNGGFRDLLNSNIGNDVIEFANGDTSELYLCDFDTFRIVEIPEKPDEEFLKRFFLQCFVEVVKGSLPIIDFVQDSNEAVESYLKISSLYHAYRREFFNWAKKLCWNTSQLERIEKWAISTPIFKRTVTEILPSYERLKDLPHREPTYKPHYSDQKCIK
ncbi:hypothetical protein ACFL0W_01990 [Nanoarchaeota archaeon]